MTTRKRSRTGDIRETLLKIQEEYWSGIEGAREEVPAQTECFLVFRLGGERYAIPARTAREVLRIPRIVGVPMLPPSILGIINLRGEIVAVSDVRPFLGLPSKELTGEGRLVVAKSAGILTALAVEGIEGLRTVSCDEIEPLTEGLAGLPREAVEGQVTTGEDVLVLLRLDHILEQPQFIMDVEHG